MAQIIKITLLKGLAVNTAKNETFQKGAIDKAADQKNVTVAYHESAGDDEYHERMLARGFFSQCEMLKAWFADYLTAGDGSPVALPLVSSEEGEESVEITLRVSDRFNLGYVTTLARLSQKYVEDRMIHLWWATSDEKKSAYYAKLADEDLAGITQCFIKTVPAAPSYNFPDIITLSFPILDPEVRAAGFSPAGTVPADTLMSYPYIIAAGEETEVTYVLACKSGKKPVDDIIIRADDGCCMPCLDEMGRWQLRGIRPGISIVTLQSRHDDRVSAQFALRVTE